MSHNPLRSRAIAYPLRYLVNPLTLMTPFNPPHVEDKLYQKNMGQGPIGRHDVPATDRAGMEANLKESCRFVLWWSFLKHSENENLNRFRGHCGTRGPAHALHGLSPLLLSVWSRLAVSASLMSASLVCLCSPSCVGLRCLFDIFIHCVWNHNVTNRNYITYWYDIAYYM